MRKVVKLVEYTCRDTVSALKVLLSLAVNGKLRGLVVFYRTEDGRDETIYTGLYRVRPDLALNASLKLSVTQMQVRGDFD